MHVLLAILVVGILIGFAAHHYHFSLKDKINTVERDLTASADSIERYFDGRLNTIEGKIKDLTSKK